MSLTLRVPLRGPVVVGVEVTLIVQVELAASELPQVFVCEKSPVIVMLLMESEPVPLFVSVTF